MDAVDPRLLLAHWHDAVIPGLTDVLRGHAADGKPINVLEDPVDAHIRVWNLIGALAIEHGRPAFATDLFRALLRELRALQPTQGRIHKGTPYHQIGWSMLASGDFAAAEEYFVFAAIEDIILSGGSASQLNSPASQTLQMQFGYGQERFEGLVRRLRKVQEPRNAEGKLMLENPELLFVEPDRTATLAAPTDQDAV